jgi:hypothetical protein
VKKPTPRERVERAEDIYKPLRQDARPAPYADDPPAETPPEPEIPAAVTPPAPVTPAPPPQGGVEDLGDASTAVSPVALPMAAPTTPPPASITASDMAVLGVLALIVLVPLGLGIWWILLSRGEDRTAAEESS